MHSNEQPRMLCTQSNAMASTVAGFFADRLARALVLGAMPTNGVDDAIVRKSQIRALLQHGCVIITPSSFKKAHTLPSQESKKHTLFPLKNQKTHTLPSQELVVLLGQRSVQHHPVCHKQARGLSGLD
jgi:hypothetical protein